MFKKILWCISTRLRCLFGKNARTVWISHPMFLQHQPGSNHPDRPERISAIQTALKQEGIWRRLQTAEAPEIKDAQLTLVHSRNYLHELETAQPLPGKVHRIDNDTVICHNPFQATRFAAGAVVKIVDMVMNKKAWHIFCAIRPPGRHAHSNSADGSCLVNNIATGVMHAIAQYRLQRIAVIDFDVRFGDGTAEILQDDLRMMFFNLFGTDILPLPQAGQYAGNKNMLHMPLKPGTGSRIFRTIIHEQWLPKLTTSRPELVLLSAGFDGYKQDETGRLNLHEADFARLTYKIVRATANCQGRVVSVLEGGYTLESMSKSAAAHIRALAGLSKADYVVAYQKHLKRSKSNNPTP